MKHNVA